MVDAKGQLSDSHFSLALNNNGSSFSLDCSAFRWLLLLLPVLLSSIDNKLLLSAQTGLKIKSCEVKLKRAHTWQLPSNGSKLLKSFLNPKKTSQTFRAKNHSNFINKRQPSNDSR
jgi:hypothetical protein